MHVGIDVSPLTLHPTGVGIYTRSLLRHLMALEQECVFSGLSSGLAEMDEEALRTLAHHRHLHVPTRGVYRTWSLFGRPRADRLLGGVDLYHATNYFLPPVQRGGGVLTIYDLAFLRRPELCSPRIVGPFSRSVRRFATQADAVLTCSEATKRDLIELCGLGEEKITVAYGAVEEGFQPRDREEAKHFLAERHGLETPFVLFVSTIEPRKNVEGLVSAFASIAGDIPHTLVLAGGTGWNAEGVDERIESLDLRDRVRRLGYIGSRTELPFLYSAADAFVFPSFYEGFGLPVLEAMACGCPVVVSNTSSLPEVAGEAGFYVNPEDIEAMASVLREVLTDEGLRAEAREKGLAQAQRFSWEETARTTMDLYQRLCR